MTDTITPDQLGVGMRLSVHPHCDDYVAVILGALEDAQHAGAGEGLEVETDEVSTYVAARGEHPEQRLVQYAAALVAAAHRRSDGGHVVAHVLLSRGCPGEATCEPTAAQLPRATAIELPGTGIRAAAQWSLYPLLDGGPDDAHMDHIEAAIKEAQSRGTAAEPAHYATLLTGDLGDVLATAADAWARVGQEVAHVVTHLTVSVGSPSSGSHDVEG
ncbi:Ykof family thiamine-binding protein [Nocardioides coralli]|uniref:Ykof family thiamine-binding protein n=1 Tax=Nocardioides coralli TaxID=2872154 RepID=UPI001CA4086E|nr:Ykof family thiamine-binding protein [Nocardioides coralli]QZY28966.1 Ykof family thiamine-binding protein [Nocardioides coralli]